MRLLLPLLSFELFSELFIKKNYKLFYLISKIRIQVRQFYLFLLTGGEIGGFESLLFEFGEEIC